MTRTGERTSQAGDAGLVLVLNSGSSSVKFALVDPGSGRRTAWPDHADLVVHGRAEELYPLQQVAVADEALANVLLARLAHALGVARIVE